MHHGKPESLNRLPANGSLGRMSAALVTTASQDDWARF
jgi:hypothetical protein